MIKSPQFTLIKADWRSLGIGLAKTAIGSISSYLLAQLTGIDFGEYAVIMVPTITFLLNLGIKWGTSSTYIK